MRERERKRAREKARRRNRDRLRYSMTWEEYKHTLRDGPGSHGQNSVEKINFLLHAYRGMLRKI